MNPRLVAIDGPLKGKTFALESKEIIIGRDSSVEISVHDSSLSRRHCKLSKANDEFRIADLESLNGTFVDRIPIKEKTLAHGNEIEIGHSVFLFLIEDDDQFIPSAILVDSTDEPRSTVQLRTEDALYLRPDVSSRIQRESRAARDLSVLLRISTTIHTIKKPADLQKRMLEMLFDAVPATHGAFLITKKRCI